MSVEIDNEATLTLPVAVYQIVQVMRGSRYSKEALATAARPIAYIVDMLGLTESQAVMYAIVMDRYYDTHISTCDIAHCFDISPIQAISFHEELDLLCDAGYLVRQLSSDDVDCSYRVTQDAIDSLKRNAPIEHQRVMYRDEEEWFGALDKLVMERIKDRMDFKTFYQRVGILVDDNKQLNFVKQYTHKAKMLDTNDRMLFLWICNMAVSDGYRVVAPDDFRSLYSDSMTYRAQRRTLSNGSNDLIKHKLLQVAASDNIRARDNFELTQSCIETMLKGLVESTATAAPKDLIESTKITEKRLFYGPKEEKAIERLSELLQPARFDEVRQALKAQGFRNGFACLFYGAPGTGKTETALQLARATGRDIMQVNISEIKSAWVGESEKNVKAIFSRYYKLSKNCKQTPILLFNEADAIIGKRLENTARSVDKMENAMQNILLEEIEKLDGILIATTNLTSNMDKAFERRFIYKIEFEKPSVEAKCAIWHSMISDLSEIDARMLAEKYDFSGGQIENIARKNIVDTILLGEKISVETLCDHCDSEMIDRKAGRNRIGF
jgi:hypothetical protein